MHIKAGAAASTQHSNTARAVAARGAPEEIPMMDVVMIAIGVAFFVLAIGYVVACDRM